MECKSCGKEIPAGADSCPDCTPAEAKTEGGTFKTAIKIVALIIGVGVMLIAVVVGAIALPGFIGARDRASFEKCLASLNDVRTGLQMQLSKTESLDGLGNTAEEICNEIIPGQSSAAACRGQVKKKVDAACAEGSFNIVYPGESKFEISAKVKDSSSCAICVSEAGPSPAEYNLCKSAEPTCEH